jgi:cytochrome c-type biogenesis protein CcmH
MMRAVFLLFAVLNAQAFAVEVRQFASPEEEQRYEHLVRDLRCLVCQNQSLADSDADLARDLRDEVFKMIHEGKSEQEASQFLVDRYGDFVLYRPPFNPQTLLLWTGPLLVLFGALALVRHQARLRACATDVQLSADERARLDALKNRLGD